jgi:hypothetical protein
MIRVGEHIVGPVFILKADPESALTIARDMPRSR